MAPFIGLLGTLLGGLIACLGILFTHRIQEKRERRQWLRAKKEEAYSQSCRSLLRLRNTRSRITATGSTLLDVKDIKGWFDDYVESLFWISQISLYSAGSYSTYEIGRKADRLRNCIEDLFEGKYHFIKEQDVEQTLERGTRESRSGEGLGLSVAREITQPREEPGDQCTGTEKVFIPRLIQDLVDAILAAARHETDFLLQNSGVTT